jgi:ABC-type sugar transport system substrate-binding protein
MKKSLLIAAVIAMALLQTTTAQAGDCYSEGVRVGVIQKFSQKGFVNKSWEGEMVQEGERVKAKGQGAGVTNIWKFSVLDAAIARKLDDAVMSGGVVAVRYCQVAFTGWETDTQYRITDVRARQ